MLKIQLGVAAAALLLSSCASSSSLFSFLGGEGDKQEAQTATSSSTSRKVYADWLAKLQGTVVTKEQIAGRLRAFNSERAVAIAQDAKAYRELVVKSLVREYILSEAYLAQLDSNPQTAELMRQAQEQVLIDRWLKQNSTPIAAYPDDERIKQAYEKNRQQFTVPGQVNLSQIFVARKEGDKEGAQAKGRVEKVAAALKAKGDFAALAKEHSDHKQSAENGGALGWSRIDKVNPAILKAIGSLKQGEVSSVVETQGGYHLVKVNGIQPATLRPLEEVRTVLVKALRLERQQQKQKALIQQLTNAVEVRETAR